MTSAITHPHGALRFITGPIPAAVTEIVSTMVAPPAEIATLSIFQQPPVPNAMAATLLVMEAVEVVVNKVSNRSDGWDKM